MLQTIEPPSTATLSQPGDNFDFAKYHRPELVERVAELVSVPATIESILKWTVLAVVATWIGLPMLFADRVHWALLTGLLTYGTMAGIIVGVLLGIAAKLAKSLDDLSRVIITSIEVAEQVSTDAASIRAGSTAMPTGEETLVGVYEHIIMPAVKAGLSRNTWIVGKVIYWVHSWTLNRILKRVIQAVGRQKRPTNVDAAIENLDSAAERAAAWLKLAHGQFDGIGTGLRRIIGWPVMLFLTLFFVLLALPIATVWWLT